MLPDVLVVGGTEGDEGGGGVGAGGGDRGCGGDGGVDECVVLLRLMLCLLVPVASCGETELNCSTDCRLHQPSLPPSLSPYRLQPTNITLAPACYYRVDLLPHTSFLLAPSTILNKYVTIPLVYKIATINYSFMQIFS